MLSSLNEFAKRRCFAFEDMLFDLRHGITTRGDNSTWCRNLRTLLRWSRASGFDATTFVDLGSGQGKACLYAYENGFLDIDAVELDWSLFSGRTYRLFPARRHAQSAADFILRDVRNLVFMFNPFDGDVLAGFLANNGGSFQIAYANDIHRDVIAANGFRCLNRDGLRKLSLWQRG